MNETRSIIGIDPGTNCGWAVLTANGTHVASGTWDLKPRRHEGGGMRYLRARRFFQELADSRHPGPAIVVYEEVRRHQGTDAAHVYAGIVSQIVAVCEERSIPYQGIPVAEVKKRATGKGNADKNAVHAAARDRFGMIAASYDEADALWIADCGRELLPTFR